MDKKRSFVLEGLKKELSVDKSIFQGNGIGACEDSDILQRGMMYF